MEIVLLERIQRLGQMGDIVRVKNGYARNYLIPQGKALLATPVNIAKFENQRAEIETRSLAFRQEAESAAERINGMRVVICGRRPRVAISTGRYRPRTLLVPAPHRASRLTASRLSPSGA